MAAAQGEDGVGELGDAAAAGDVGQGDGAGLGTRVKAGGNQDGNGMFEGPRDCAKKEQGPLGAARAAARHQEREVIDNGYVRFVKVDRPPQLVAEIAADIPAKLRLGLLIKTGHEALESFGEPVADAADLLMGVPRCGVAVFELVGRVLEIDVEDTLWRDVRRKPPACQQLGQLHRQHAFSNTRFTRQHRHLSLAPKIAKQRPERLCRSAVFQVLWQFEKRFFARRRWFPLFIST